MRRRSGGGAEEWSSGAVEQWSSGAVEKEGKGVRERGGGAGDTYNDRRVPLLSRAVGVGVHVAEYRVAGLIDVQSVH